MNRTPLAALLTTALLASACTTTRRTAAAIIPPAERMQCQPWTRADRPTIQPEFVIDWSRIATVPQARAGHDAYVASIRARERLIAGYVVAIEGKLFVCANNAAWLRDFFARLPAPTD